MFSFLGDLFGFLLICLWNLFQKTAEEIALAVDGCREFFCVWFNKPYDSPQQTIASSRLTVGPPKKLTMWPWSLLRPTPLARVRVPARHSIR